jgi:hypothetical protein
MKKYLQAGRILAMAIVLTAGDCSGGTSNGNSSASQQAKALQIPPAAAPTPTPMAPPPAIVFPDSLLRPNIDVPSFALASGAAQFNVQANFENDFPYLTGWAECITLRRDHNPTDPAKCIVKKFRLLEFNIATGAETQVAENDFTDNDNGRIRCAFTNANPPVRIENTTCNGANYRREYEGQLCWYNWCLVGPHPPGATGDGIAPMTNGLIDSVTHSLTIDAAADPKHVAHWWTYTTTDPYRPRSQTNQGYQYIVEIEFYTVGDAVLRVGADRWAEKGQASLCSMSNNSYSANCQLYFSNWLQTPTQIAQKARLRVAG